MGLVPRPFSDAVAPAGPAEAGLRAIRRYVRGQPVHIADHTLSDALFLSAHPSWSQRDLNEADQDIVDYLSAIQLETAKRSREEHAQAFREREATRIRSNL